ncbi:hypothetical protein SDC9_61111 [bioreactor metagenome]|uniref:Uncharacterized protein n=1 Tax=bioreactor metagenome TaxID=1076179 RepID=A0A644XFS1_9ZZZZ
MATVLENYWSIRAEIESRMEKEPATATMVWWFGELAYRIGVLETCQMFCRSAPSSTDVKTLLGHYQMVDAYIQCMTQERRYGPNRGPDTQKERDAAQVNLERVVQDYRGRFSSFAPTAPDYYAKEIGRVVNTILPAWLQFRDAFIPIKKTKKGGAANEQ